MYQTCIKDEVDINIGLWCVYLSLTWVGRPEGSVVGTCKETVCEMHNLGAEIQSASIGRDPSRTDILDILFLLARYRWSTSRASPAVVPCVKLLTRVGVSVGRTVGNPVGSCVDKTWKGSKSPRHKYLESI